MGSVASSRGRGYGVRSALAKSRHTVRLTHARSSLPHPNVDRGSLSGAVADRDQRCMAEPRGSAGGIATPRLRRRLVVLASDSPLLRRDGESRDDAVPAVVVARDVDARMPACDVGARKQGIYLSCPVIPRISIRYSTASSAVPLARGKPPMRVSGPRTGEEFSVPRPASRP